MLKELKKKKYPFPDSDFSRMPDDLFNFRSQRDPRKLEGLPTKNTIGITR